MDFMMDLKSLIAKSATDAELNRIKLALNREDHSMAPENYGHTSETFHQSGDYTF